MHSRKKLARNRGHHDLREAHIAHALIWLGQQEIADLVGLARVAQPEFSIPLTDAIQDTEFR